MPEGFLTQGAASVAVLVIAVGLFLFWANMLADCARRNFMRRRNKIWWILALAFLQVIGAFAYWLLVQRKTLLNHRLEGTVPN